MSTNTKKQLRFVTPPFVLSYPHLFKAQKGISKDAAPQFSAQAIWEPSKFGEADKKLWVAIRRELCRQLKETFKVDGKNLTEMGKALTKKFPKAWIALRNGDEGDFADRAGYGAGKVFARLHTVSPPGVVDLSKQTIHPSEGNSDEIYPGCICRATVTVKAYDHKESGGKGYTFYLGNVQKIKDGPRLDSRVAAEDDFDEEVDGAWLDAEDDTAGESAEDEEIPF